MVQPGWTPKSDWTRAALNTSAHGLRLYLDGFESRALVRGQQPAASVCQGSRTGEDSVACKFIRTAPYSSASKRGAARGLTAVGKNMGTDDDVVCLRRTFLNLTGCTDPPPPQPALLAADARSAVACMKALCASKTCPLASAVSTQAMWCLVECSAGFLHS